MVNSTISDTELTENEYCTLVTTQRDTLSYYKAKVTKLMPSVVNGRVTFNRNILVNAGSCKPSSSNYIDVQNYITIARSAMCDLTAFTSKKYRYLRSGTILKCRCMNGNYKTLTIIDK